MSPEDNASDAARRLVEASAWRVQLTTLEVESTAEFEAWLAADARNAEAWQRVEAPWHFLGAHAAEPELLVARREALRTTPRFGLPIPPRAVPWRAIAGVALGAILVLGGALYWWLSPIGYRTALGERRTLVLSDGSRLTLDSNSEVRISYSGDERDIDLVRGQARFEVAHDASRPFLVTAAGAVVRATGTDFDVDRPEGHLNVTLIEGHVAISTGREQVELASGEQLVLVPPQRPKVVPVDVADVLAWQSGQVVFHGSTLAAVIESLNRYDQLQLALADRRLASLRISGTFNTGNAGRNADLIARELGIRALNTEDGRILFEP